MDQIIVPTTNSENLNPPTPTPSKTTWLDLKVSKILILISYFLLSFFGNWIYLWLFSLALIFGRDVPYFATFFGPLVVNTVFAILDFNYEDYLPTYFIALLLAIITSWPKIDTLGEYASFHLDITRFLISLIALIPFAIATLDKSIKFKRYKYFLTFMGTTVLSFLIIVGIGFTYQKIYPPKVAGFQTGKPLTVDQQIAFAKLRGDSALELQQQNITVIPEALFELTNLQTLWLPKNNITSIPTEIGNLTNLTTLDLSDNKLTRLPEQISNLKKLQMLDLSGNPIGQAAQQQILDWLPNVKINFGLGFVDNVPPPQPLVNFTLDNANVTANPNQQIQFTGKIVNNSGGNVYLNGLSLNLYSTDLTGDNSPFYQLPSSLKFGESATGTIFTVLVSKTTLPGDYTGTVIMQGGNQKNSFDDLGEQPIVIHIAK